ncbi:PilT/PilU family type 4a pilus ATPase [Campylobacter sp. CX2-4080-23]|uniref:type IV pilus twitching motility protein PilT n=1 Tax=Campylobacter porcelli TaxID=1660073 RepID=UPI002EAFB17D|nr:PilT/PilU family type 4a pilus ATPase [Campylobacter sp. CX2-4080-23]
MSIRTFLDLVIDRKASDLHLVARSVPKIRVDGELISTGSVALTPKDVEEICLPLLSQEQKMELKSAKELDFIVDLNRAGRFRANYYYTMNGELCAAFRIIPFKTPTLDDICAPNLLFELAKKQKGLILVTGATGSGKSTTLAAILNEINQTQNRHIITIEDPVEFIHTSKNSLFSHRNVGSDTSSFSKALKYALRQDPDVILVGEMRDKETMAMTIEAAQTGHLVFATLHTNSAPSSIDRIVDSFSLSDQSYIRSSLASSLIAVISQNLLPKIGGGRIALFEIMLNNIAISNLIRDGKTHQILSQMQIGSAQSGMRVMANEIQKALNENIITKEVAMRFNTENLNLMEQS